MNTGQSTNEAPLSPFEQRLLDVIDSLPREPRAPTPRPTTDADFARIADTVGVFRNWETPASVIDAFLASHEVTLAEVQARAPRLRLEAEGCVFWARRDATVAESIAELERQLGLLALAEPAAAGGFH